MSNGMNGHFGLVKQTAFQGSGTVATFIPFISETVKHSIDQLVSQGIRTRFDEGPSFEGVNKYSGDLVMDVHPLTIGHFFRGLHGQSSSTATGSAFLHEFVPLQSDFAINCALPPYTIEVYKGIGNAHRYYDAVFHKLDLDITANALVKATVGIHARDEAMVAKSTPTFATDNLWGWNVTSATLGGVAITDIENLKISYSEAVEGQVTLNGTKTVSQFRRTGHRSIKITGSVIYNVQSQYIDFTNQTEQRLLINLGANVTSYNTMTLDYPKLRFTDFNPNISGPGLVKVSFNADCKFDTTSNYTSRITMVNTLSTY